MLLPRLGALLLAATSAHAFQNTSPFLLLSSSPLESDVPLRSTQVALSQDVDGSLHMTLWGCDKRMYYIIQQPSVSAVDFTNGKMPKLQRRIASAEQEGKVVSIPEIMGTVTEESVRSRVESACRLMGKKQAESFPESDNEYRIITSTLPDLPSDKSARTKAIKDTDDALIDTVSSVLDGEQPSVLIYITTPPAPPVSQQEQEGLYEMDEPYPPALHTDLKRDLLAHRRQAGGNDTHMQDGLPLFEKYQFLTPGLFMTLSVSLLLLIILYVGISAISGLEVSYMAFSKEMGPQAQRQKQQ